MNGQTSGGTWLVTGGAGYIGSHVVRALEEAREHAVVFDDMSTGVPERVKGFPIVRGSVLDAELIARTCAEYGVTGVIHLAAKKRADESVRKPLLYYRENVDGLRCVLEAISEAGVRSMVFSSSAAVYGQASRPFISEDDLCLPVSPYGRTKLIGEHLIRDVRAVTGLRAVTLRYFNVAGAREPILGDRLSPGLISSTLRRLAAGRAPVIFGSDYPTPDGTCVRDFIHVADVASAHVAAVLALVRGEVDALTVNIGSGKGASVLEVVEAARSISGAGGPARTQPIWRPRRAGDPAYSVAAVDRAQQRLRWSARAGLDEMVASTWSSLQCEH